MPDLNPSQRNRPPTRSMDFDARITGVAALGEPVRRALYLYVVGQQDPVSRDQASEGAHVPRHVAKFHLDKLVGDGLLEVEFRRPPGRSGPGAGRPAKLYRRSSQEMTISLPERRYDVAGWIMARAITRAMTQVIPLAEAVNDAASETGRLVGEGLRQLPDPISGIGQQFAAVSELLEEYGYEPKVEAEGLTLGNCPFHALAQDYKDLVCGMNVSLLSGLLEGAECTNLEALLDPAPGKCCVRIQER